MKITAIQLSDNPEFPPEIAFETPGGFMANDLIRCLIAGYEEDPGKYEKGIDNVGATQPDPGQYIVSFRWDGEYAGVIVFQVLAF